MRCKWGQAPPSGTPPFSGTFGAHPVHPFGAPGIVRDLGITDSHARAKPLLTAALAPLQEGLGE